MAFILDESAIPVNAAPGGADLIKDTTIETFMEDVVVASQQVPVIVDFWAPWCGPCKTLGPMLEKLVRQSGGKVRMVKVNVDEEQQIAAQFQIQTVPTVYAFKGGRPVDAFQGAQQESQLKRFIDTLVGGGANVLDEALEQARAFLAEGDVDTATQIYQQILGQDPAHAGAIAGMLRCYLARGLNDEAAQVIASLPDALQKHAGIQAISTELALLAQGADDCAPLEAKVAANPDDHQAYIDLALAYYAAGRKEEACDILLASIRRDRSWNEEEARKQLLKLFEAMGHADPITKAARRKLSAVWLA
ncbi:thioredoxin [Insolitispirillum peregrinum]|uniref:Thioredoxin n=1 Tax=Insolitispirillum peregrinum TaxID=80876 RepID=A0A1N7JCY4_9PROT|nr:thioredoxin [Insolitispirillum peregrinum]SIS47136.1 thioredoxin [Insolitispirillum peregrinum]